MGFLKRKAAGYKAGIRVEKYRAAAADLREREPETYARVLAQADGSEAEGAAHRDPDAYVALFLASWNDAEREEGRTGVVSDRDVDYWPDLDLDAIWAGANNFFQEGLKDRGEEQLYFPGWMVRRVVVAEVLSRAVLVRPTLADDIEAIPAARSTSPHFRFTASPSRRPPCSSTINNSLRFAGTPSRIASMCSAEGGVGSSRTCFGSFTLGSRHGFGSTPT
jgi:hypothetical protein